MESEDERASDLQIKWPLQCQQDRGVKGPQGDLGNHVGTPASVDCATPM